MTTVPWQTKTMFFLDGLLMTSLHHTGLSVELLSVFFGSFGSPPALGRPGHTLPTNVPVPTNCRVADYIPYDDVLPHSDVFVTTGEYGSFQRALHHGTPLVMAGTTEEKPEMAARAEWAGVGVNLRTSHPSVEQLGQAVDEVLSNGKYKSRAFEIQAEIATYDPVGVIVENIEELVARSN
ncbi:hypothetical protein VTI74DRAFT_4588 [Chaetomium olivicolor]